MGLCEGGLGDHTFRPLQRLLFAPGRRPCCSAGLQDLVARRGTSEFLDELADAAPTDGPVNAFIDGLADVIVSCRFMVSPIRIVHVLGRADGGDRSIMRIKKFRDPADF
jgi:hypothetical protein